MKTIILRTTWIGIFLHLAIAFYAQKVTIQGVLADTLNEPLMSATVVLLNPQDSTMEYFAITSSTGNFKIKGIKPGEYVFQASYLGYKSIFNPIDLTKEKAILPMGTLLLKPERKTLGEVIVNGERIPILIKKDTVEYNAGSFKVKPNAAVEELLKRLPGVEVDKDGTIKAHGEKVNSIMVDGKEFFGNDPKIASQNLPADAVDKVQVYDKKSEIADFTGVDDGVRNKTINLQLKDGKKKGYFGNIAAGYGSDNRFESKININRFNKKSQLSLLGRANNINQQGFSFNDYLTFAGGLQNVMMENGGGDGELGLDGNNGPIPFDTGQPNYGFTKSGSGGANFNYDFSKKTDFTGSYFFSHLKKREEIESARQNFLDENIFASDRIQDQTTKNNSHRFNMKLKTKIDSNQILTLRTNFTLSDGAFQQVLNNRVYNVTNNLQNSNWSKNGYDNQNWNANAGLSYLLKFKKKGRSLAASIGAGFQDKQRMNEVESINSFLLDNPNLTFTDSLNQIQNEDGNQFDYSLRISFTEPIGKRGYLQFRYNRRNYSNELVKDFFDVKNEAQSRNIILSNAYQRDYTYDRPGLTFKLNRKKYIFSTGADFQYSRLDGKISNIENTITKDFWAVLPSSNFNYDLSTSSSFGINYRTSIKEPSLEQLQPVVDNTDPLNLYIGNTDLKPEYRHRFSLRYNLFDQFNFRSLFASVNSTFTKDKITNSRSFDSLFIQTTQPINVKNDWATRGYISFGTPLKFMRSKMNLSLNGNYNHGILLLNNIENESDRWSTAIDFKIENRKKKVVDILLGINWGYNQTSYSINESFNQNYNTLNYYTDWTFSLKKDWTLGTTFDYTIYQGGGFDNQRQVPMWNASVSKSVFKNRGTIELSARDLLNQGIGVDRRSTLNYIEDVRINSLGRYLMLTFSYSLTMLGDQTPGGIMIETGGRRRN